ncbi:NADH dehydrogenase (ubiquinone) 15 kDa subunit isoform X2 [Oratosquilla oratoria]|uniref:NADH dehydrogenase (ubiquinone) 15 kDa subunit isoform X2 n=1 Tax=Oratosquilla oratoria TaxID=337810 RepID=UPI003F75C3D7
MWHPSNATGISKIAGINFRGKMAHIPPFLRTPLTDMTGQILTHQTNGICRDFEMRAMECLEGYGIKDGRSKCLDYMDDLRECMFRKKQKTHSFQKTSNSLQSGP